MPSLKPIKRLSKPQTATVKAKPKPKKLSDNVITTAAKPIKAKPLKSATKVDTSPVDVHAKAYNITLLDGTTRTVKGYVVTSIGEVLGITGVTATRWEKQGLIPKPIFATGRGAIYHIEEVRSFYALLNEHQKHHRQYRAEHADLRRKLFSENAQIRRGLFPTSK